jgi:MFS family permease
MNRSKATYALWVLFGINMMNFFDRQILAAVTEPIRMEWQLSDSALGWLKHGVRVAVCRGGCSAGRLSDRWLRTRILSIGVTVWSLFTAASGAAWNYWSLFAVRLGVGVGEASCAPAANSLIGDLFPPQKRARAISIFMLGLPIGIFTSNLTSGIIAKQYGWRVTFFIACIPGLILAALALRIREPHRGGAEEHHVVGQQQEGSPYWRVLRIPTIWWIIVSGALHNFNAYAVNAFLRLFLAVSRDGPSAGQYYRGDSLGAVGVVGLLGGGWAADKFRQTRANGRMLLATASMFVSTPLVYLALDRPKGDLVGFMLLMGFGWMLIYVYYATVYAAIQDVVEPGLRATAMALYFFAMYVLGGSFGTSILGMLSDHYAREAMTAAGASAMSEAFRAEGLHNAFYVVPLVSLVLAGVLYAGSRTIAKDMDKLQRWMRESAAKAPVKSAEAAN